MSDSITTKVCRKCGEVLPPGEFHAHKRGKNGFRAVCKTCINRQNAEWRSKNREYIRKHDAEYRRNNPERVAELRAEWRSKNRERLAEQRAEYRRNNLDIYRASNHRHEARKRNAQGTHTAQEMRDQFTRQKGICYYCDCKLIHPFEPKPKTTKKAIAHWEHIIPLVRGGRNDLSNLVWACAKCNLSKNDRLLGIEWKAPNGRLI